MEKYPNENNENIYNPINNSAENKDNKEETSFTIDTSTDSTKVEKETNLYSESNSYSEYQKDNNNTNSNNLYNYTSLNNQNNDSYPSTSYINGNSYNQNSNSQNNQDNKNYNSSYNYSNNANQHANPYTSHYGNTTHTYQPPQNPKQRKKPKATVSVGMLAVLLIFTVLISGTIGTVGGFVATNMFSDNSTGSSVTTTMPQTSNPIPKGEGMTIEEIVASTADTVVEITTEIVETGSFNQQYIKSGAGSGVIVSEDGYIMTNNHVIEGATKIQVTLRNGKSYEAKLVGTAQPTLDIAIIKIDAKKLNYAKMGDSNSLQVGQDIVVIGNPLGQLGGSVTDGIISALNRDLTIDGVTLNLLQTNAAINPGNSGGGMFNAQGELVGIVVAKSTGDEIEGLGFVIPINQAKEVSEDLKEYGYIRGNIQVGMSLVDITNEQMAMMYNVGELGVYIQSVELNSSAFKSGLQGGDRIIAIDGKEVNTAQEIKDIFKKHKVDDVVKVKVSRGGETGELELTLTESVPDDIQRETDQNNDGMFR